MVRHIYLSVSIRVNFILYPPTLLPPSPNKEGFSSPRSSASPSIPPHPGFHTSPYRKPAGAHTKCLSSPRPATRKWSSNETWRSPLLRIPYLEQAATPAIPPSPVPFTSPSPPTLHFLALRARRLDRVSCRRSPRLSRSAPVAKDARDGFGRFARSWAWGARGSGG